MLRQENFAEEHIRELQKNSKRDPVLLERAVYAFGLLEALARVGMPFIFKGGVKKMDKPIVMTLCPVCAKPFYESDEHYIKRADLHQKIKGDCMFCNVRTGYDYLIRKKY